MPQLNRISIIGNLVDAPKEIDGKNLGAKFSVAVNEGAGDYKTTTFFDCIAWDGEYNKLATTCLDYGRKGEAVYVEGPMRSRTWEADDGTKRKSWEIQAKAVQLLTPRSDRGDRDDRDDGRSRRESFEPRSRGPRDDRQTRYEGRDPEPRRTKADDDDGLPF